MAGIQVPMHPDAIFWCACQWVMVVRLDRTRSLNLGEVRFVLLCLLGHLGCTERSVRLARTTITSTPRSVNNVEVRSISNLLVDQGGLLPSEGNGVSVVRVTCSTFLPLLLHIAL